jgi:hypothetical protein
MGFNSAFNYRVKVEGYIRLSYRIPKLINPYPANVEYRVS